MSSMSGVEQLAKLARQRVEPVGAAAGADHLPAVGDELARGGGADPGGRAGDEGGLGHWSLSRSRIQSVAVGQSSIRAWACSAGGTAGASRGSATMCSRWTSGACLATEAWWTGRSSTNAVRVAP